MKIAGREIGPKQPPYIIAEVSCNHGGSLDRAEELIDAAKACGADAVKFQVVTPDTHTIDCDRPEFIIQCGPWKGRSLYQLYKDTETPFDWFPHIAKYAAKTGITWFASVTTKASVDLIHGLGAPALKIPSFELTDIPLIKYAAGTGLPLILSTGMASGIEIEAAAKALEPYRQNQHALLHCVSDYPTRPEEANLLRLKYGIKFGFVDGISDHSNGPEIPIAAVACGACIIEKHFRLSWHPNTEDSPFSLDEAEFYQMTKQVHRTWAAMSAPPLETSEAAHRPLRRSLFCIANLKAGEKFTEGNVRPIRPGHGLPPGALDMVIGRFAARDVERGEPITWEMVR
jgi:pseudaminic acid synthase